MIAVYLSVSVISRWPGEAYTGDNIEAGRSDGSEPYVNHQLKGLGFWRERQGPHSSSTNARFACTWWVQIKTISFLTLRGLKVKPRIDIAVFAFLLSTT